MFVIVEINSHITKHFNEHDCAVVWFRTHFEGRTKSKFFII